MKPISPVIKDRNLQETVFAEHQDEYQNLPSIVLENGQVITRWKLSLRERLKVLFSGDIYLWIWSFGNPLQPVLLEVEPPKFMEGANGNHK